MKLIKEYKHIDTYKGRKIIDLKHSESEFKKHMNNLSFDIWLDVMKKGIDKIINEYNDISDRYIIRSNKYGFGIQVDWRPDIYDKNKINHAFTATTLSPEENKFYTKNDEAEYKKESFDKAYYNIEHINEDMKNFKYDIFIKSNKLYYTYDVIDI